MDKIQKYFVKNVKCNGKRTVTALFVFRYCQSLPTTMTLRKRPRSPSPVRGLMKYGVSLSLKENCVICQNQLVK